MRIFTQIDFKTMPWKNGKGMTTELLRIPEEGDFIIRMSQARISENGPFSQYSGIERVLVILNGAGCELEIRQGEKITLTTLSEPFHFRGEEQVYCRLLSGEVEDFNVMVREDQAKPIVHRVPPGKVLEVQNMCYYFSPSARTLTELDSGDSLLSDGGILIEIKKGPRAP